MIRDHLFPPGATGMNGSLHPLLSSLSEEQRDAVTTVSGPVLVLAGAGSGKTRVIIHRIAWLLENGVCPGRILALTFTNKAANEMRERVKALVRSAESDGLVISTFHSFGLSILRGARKWLGRAADFTVMDESDRDSLIRQVRTEMRLTDRDLTLDEIALFLMRVKGCGASPEEAAAAYGARKGNLLADFLDRYNRHLALAESFDFDDLILLPVRLFEESPDALAYFAGRFDHVMVDEYQDTNFLQFRLLRLLVGNHNNVCVVGDDDQSIYSWRGARVENILEFESSFPEVKVVKLTRNYRSQRNILQLANALIARNTRRRSKELWTDNQMEYPIVKMGFDSQQEEAREIAAMVRSLVRGGKSQARDIAILYRTRGQSRHLQEAFRLEGMPYRVVGSFDFFETKEVRDILAYLRLALNPKDRVSFHRVVNYPSRGIGLATMERIEAMRTGDMSLFDAAVALVEAGNDDLPVRTRRSLCEFLALIERSNKELPSLSGPALAKAVERLLCDAGVADDLSVRAGFGVRRMEILLRMLREGLDNRTFFTLREFLEKVTLDQWEADNALEEEGGDLVTLMTVHSAKGLEFDTVIVAGLVDGIFPHFRSMEGSDVEEERRLFYVALTRARRSLYLSTFRQREHKGRLVPAVPSRFLKELPSRLLHSRKESPAEYLPEEEFLARFKEMLSKRK